MNNHRAQSTNNKKKKPRLIVMHKAILPLRHSSHAVSRQRAKPLHLIINMRNSLFVPLLCIVSTITCHFAPDYKLALKYSILFLEAQRSGKLPKENRIDWRGDSALGDKGDHGEDLTGGYYDGTDFVKFGYMIAYVTTMLSWGFDRHPQAYQAIGETQQILEAIKWATDFLIKCHVAPNELYGQVGDFQIDHKFWGRPEEMNMSRPAFRINATHPGSDLAAEVSAALSSASKVFRNINATYSQELLQHSVDLYHFANNYRGLMKHSLPVSSQYCTELDSYNEQLVWAALWLYDATSHAQYLNTALEFFQEFHLDTVNATSFSYQQKIVGIRLLLATFTQQPPHLEYMENFCNYSIFEAPKSGKGLLYIRPQYGVLPLAGNTAFICVEVANLSHGALYIDFAKSQIDYMLGSTGRSFVVGYGENYPQRPHHSASSCPDLPASCNWQQYNSSNPNPQILYGALVSGPNSTDFYLDQREDTYLEFNVVSLDFNMGFHNCLAALIHFGLESATEDGTDTILATRISRNEK